MLQDGLPDAEIEFMVLIFSWKRKPIIKSQAKMVGCRRMVRV